MHAQKSGGDRLVFTSSMIDTCLGKGSCPLKVTRFSHNSVFLTGDPLPGNDQHNNNKTVQFISFRQLQIKKEMGGRLYHSTDKVTSDNDVPAE